MSCRRVDWESELIVVECRERESERDLLSSRTCCSETKRGSEGREGERERESGVEVDMLDATRLDIPRSLC